MSVDLVGSTALKQAGRFPLKAPSEGQQLRDVGAHWFFDLAGFYGAIEAKFAKHWRQYCEVIARSHNWPVSDAPTLWKANGDELIYVAELASAAESIALLHAWMSAAREYRQELKQKHLKLDVKLAAWTAGFPIANTEVIFQSEYRRRNLNFDHWAPEQLHFYLLEQWYLSTKARNDLVRDFIGPSIDTGFRLAARATPRQFIIGVELAMLWSLVTPLPDVIDLDVRFDGMHELKGVLGGRPYPIFWIDTMHDDRLMQCADKLSTTPAFGQNDVRKFCEAFISDHSAYIFKPFIKGAPEPALANMPENYAHIIEYMKGEWGRIKASQNAFEKSVGGENYRGAEDNDFDPATISDFNVKEI